MGAEPQELDGLIALKLDSTPVPSDLKPRLTAWEQRSLRRTTWSRAALLLVASIVAAAVMFSSWRGPFQPAVSRAGYRDEMVSFIKVPPNLELESSDLTRLQHFLAKADAPARVALPKNLRRYEPVGCRVLRFRGHDVSLVCFKIGGGQLAHLFVADAKSVPTAGRAAAPVFAAEEDWMTATWIEGGHAYLLAVKGDRAATENFLPPRDECAEIHGPKRMRRVRNASLRRESGLSR